MYAHKISIIRRYVFLFIVLTNETDRTKVLSGGQTPFEIHKQRIIHISSTGSIDNETILENILSSEIDEEILLAKSRESLNEALGNFISKMG